LARLFDLLEIWGVGITIYMLTISNSYPPKIISHDVTPQKYQYTLSHIQLTPITGVLQLNQLQIPFFDISHFYLIRGSELLHPVAAGS
jgi:hypothetical protein